jgi:hypothetical protein
MVVICPYCDKPAKLATGADIYPHRSDLVDKVFWRCVPCDAWVGCHPKHRKWSPTGTTPLGRLANAELRREKQRAHAAFDPLWRSGEMRRTEAYQWIAGQLGMSPANCHIGLLGVDGCKAVVAAVKEFQRRAA